MDCEFHRTLQQAQKGNPELIGKDLEVGELYHINRSLRRGVTGNKLPKNDAAAKKRHSRVLYLQSGVVRCRFRGNAGARCLVLAKIVYCNT